MAFKVFKEERKKEKDVYFGLFENDGEIVLRALDEAGRRIPSGNILTICEDGKLWLASGINPDIGLQLDKNSQVVVSRCRGGEE